jgi:hypothetical protein
MQVLTATCNTLPEIPAMAGIFIQTLAFSAFSPTLQVLCS